MAGVVVPFRKSPPDGGAEAFDVELWLALDSLGLVPRGSAVDPGAWLERAFAGGTSGLGAERRAGILRHAHLRGIGVPPNTWRARRGDAAAYAEWADRNGRAPLCGDGAAMAANIEDFLLDTAPRYAPATVMRRAATLSDLLRMMGHVAPDLMARRRHAARAARIGARHPNDNRLKARLSPEQIRLMLEVLADDPRVAPGIKLRDRAVILVFQDMMARRSEVAALRVGDFDPESETMFIASSKADQEGRGFVCGLSKAACAAVQEWIDYAHLSRVGPKAYLFRPLSRTGRLRRPETSRGRRAGSGLDGRDLCAIVQRRAEAAGIVAGPDEPAIASHAIRRGVARALWSRAVSDRTIMEIGRWSSEAEMRGYVGLPVVAGGASALL